MTNYDVVVSMDSETASDLRSLVIAEVSRLRLECAGRPKNNPEKGYLRGVLNRLITVETALRVVEPEPDGSEE
jgi:hypothetical protein